MIYDEMIHNMEKSHKLASPDSLEASLLDWIYLGRFVGYRSIEWCQHTQKEYSTIDHPNWEGPKLYAFIAEDFLFYTAKKEPLTKHEGLNLEDIKHFTIRFRKQKNGVNGEIV